MTNKMHAAAVYNKVLCLARFKINLCERYLSPLALLAARLYVAHIFWLSGQTKLAEGFDHAKDTFTTLFQPEWDSNKVKHILGMDVSFPVPGAALGAFGITYAEIFLAVLLALGLGGRLAAFGIFFMALCIELFVYPGTDENYYWMLLMALVIAQGPGLLSLDHIIRKKLLKTPSCDKIEQNPRDRQKPETAA